LGEERSRYMNYKSLWTLSLLAICCITIVWTVCKFAGMDLPDSAVRIRGLLDLCAIPVLIYTTIKIKEQKRQ
jgi:hypothetical protein